MKTMTREELARFDGQDGRPIYVAFDGRVFDLSASKKWRNGRHMMKHESGKDLTASLAVAPHDDKVFANFTQVAVLAAETAPQEDDVHAPWPLSWLYRKVPFVKRHSHPFAVHFPLGLILAGFLFLLLHLFFGAAPYFLEKTSFHLIALAALTAPFAVLTGMQSWWLFYGLGKTFPLMFKLFGGITTVLFAAILAVMHVLVPTLVTGPWIALSYVYVGLYALTVLLVGAVGFFGGQLTFPEA